MRMKAIMQKRIEEMFDKMYPMTEGLKKKAYETWMEEFREKHKEILKEIIESVEKAQEREEKALEIAAVFADAVESKFSKRGRISARKQVDINCFMIYYIFPAILLTQSDYAVMMADAIRDTWKVRFKNSSHLEYTDYNTIHGSFNEKIFGMF